MKITSMIGTVKYYFSYKLLLSIKLSMITIFLPIITSDRHVNAVKQLICNMNGKTKFPIIDPILPVIIVKPTQVVLKKNNYSTLA